MNKKALFKKSAIIFIVFAVILITSFFIFDKERFDVGLNIPLINIPLVSSVYTDAFNITERTEYGLTENTLYVNVKENIGKVQIINVSSLFKNHALTDAIEFKDVLLNQSYLVPKYDFINVSLGKYSTTNTTTFNSTTINHYYLSNGTEMVCEWVLPDKSCMVKRAEQIGNDTLWDFRSIPNQKSKTILSGQLVEFKNGGIPLPKNGEIQLKYTYKHPIAIVQNKPTENINKYDIEVCSTDGVDCSILDPTWFDNSWTYRKPITINATIIQNYSIKLSIPYDAKISSNWSDLRFTNDSNTELSYWIEKSNTTTAIVWVGQIHNNNTIYMYYGNQYVTSTSNIANAFAVGDEFNDSSFDTAKWDCTGGTCAEGGDYLNITTAQYNGVLQKVFNYSNVSVEMLYQESAASVSYANGLQLRRVSSTGNSGATMYYSYIAGTDTEYTARGDATWRAGAGTNFMAVNSNQSYWQRFNVRGNATLNMSAMNKSGFLLGSRPAGEQVWQSDVNIPTGYSGIHSQGNGKFLVDWIHISSYVYPEPVYSFGAEELNSADSAPTFIFNGQTPTDATATNLAGGISIRYNITGTNPVNTSTVDLYWMTNSSILPNQTSWVNGSASLVGFTTTAVTNKTNISNTFYFNIDDNVLPATYLLNPSLINNVVHQDELLETDNSLIKVMVFNMSNRTQYNILESNIINETSASDSLRIYYCNSSYTTGNIVTSSSCALVADRLASTPYNHTHNQSIHWTDGLVINTTTGTLGNIKITPSLGYFIFRGRQTDGWIARYVPSIARAGGTQTSTSLGTTYADLSGTMDYHLHQFTDDTTLNYYVCGNLTTGGIYNCSTTRSDVLNLTAIPPSPVIIYSPNGTTLNYTVFINYSSAISPVGNAIVKYNISLMNEDDSYNQTITADNGVNLTYTWINPNYTDGTFNVHVWATDSAGLYSMAESENFNLSATFQTTTSVTTSPASPITYGTASNWSCTNNYGLPTQMYVNGINKTSEKGLSITRSAGVYSINCSSAQFGGYLGSSQTTTYVINKASSTLTLSASPSNTESYGTETTVTGADCPSQLSCTLTRNSVTVSNPDVATLNAGTYSYNYSTSGNENYTAGSANLTLTINKINPSLVISVTPSVTVTNNTLTTVTGSGCPDGTCVLKRDGVIISNPESTVLAVGTYIYNYSFAGSTNYNTYSVIETITVTPVSFASNSGTINFTTTNLTSTLQFQVPYRFVTEAYMNLTSFATNATYNVTNLNVSIGNRQIFYYPGMFNHSNNRTSNFYNQLNSYLNSCSFTANYCVVPITFTSTTTGQLNYSAFRVSNEGFIELNQSYVNSTTETKAENYSINIAWDNSTYNPTAYLVFNGIEYSATVTKSGTNATITRQLLTPTGTGNKTFYWRLSMENASSTISYNSTRANTTVSLLNMSLLSAPYTPAFINFTFHNETTLNQAVNATFNSQFTYYISDPSVNKTLSYTSIIEKPNYAFAFNYNATPIYLISSGTYDNAESQQRSFTNISLVSNVSTTKDLLLLPDSNGIYITFIIQSQLLARIPSALISITKTSDGFAVEQKYTDGTGIAAFWLDSNTNYQVVISKSGYDSYTTSITPSTSPVTYTLTASSSGSGGGGIRDGISMSITPASNKLENNTQYTFTFDIDSGSQDLDEYGFSLWNSTTKLTDYESGTTTSGGTESTLFNTGNQSYIIMKWYYVVDGDYVNGTKKWYVTNTAGTGTSIKNLINRADDFIGNTTSGLFGIKKGTTNGDFSLAIVIFIVTFFLAGMMAYRFGITTMTATMFMIFSIILFFDVGAGLMPNPLGAKVPHFISILFGLVTLGFFIKEATA